MGQKSTWSTQNRILKSPKSEPRKIDKSKNGTNELHGAHKIELKKSKIEPRKIDKSKKWD